MRIGHYQCECIDADPQANIAKVVKGLTLAQADGAAICSFPEAFLCGGFATERQTRLNSWRINGPEMRDFLKRIAAFTPTCIVGFLEARGKKLHNSAMVVEKGKLLGVYRKAFTCAAFHTPGREFPVFERDGVKFGVILCADSGYVEPCRILALKGARIIFAPHYNYLPPEMIVNHFMSSRADHTARAAENGVWFVRGQNVCLKPRPGVAKPGVGFGDSYVMDPRGEIAVRCARNMENYMSINVDFERFQYYRDKCVKGAKALAAAVVRELKNAPPILSKEPFC